MSEYSINPLISFRPLAKADAAGMIAIMRKSWLEQSDALENSNEGYLPPKLIDDTFPEDPNAKRIDKSARDIARQDNLDDELMPRYIGAFTGAFVEVDDDIVFGEKFVGFVKTGRPAADRRAYSGTERITHRVKRKLMEKFRVNVRTKLEDPSLAEILELRVDSSFQKMGVGWGLLKRAVEDLPEDTIDTVRAFTGKDSVGFFEKLGFTESIPQETRMYPNSEATRDKPGQIMYGLTVGREKLLDQLQRES